MRPTAPKFFRSIFAATACALALAGPATSQGLFEPAITVNQDVITAYELDQRIKLLEVFRSPGNLDELAVEQLIEDRLKLAELSNQGLELTPDGTVRAMADFAARANLELDQFLTLLGQNGVNEETLRDFVVVGASWRAYIRQRFGPRAEPTAAEIDAALGQSSPSQSGIEVLLSEIIIAAPPPQAAQALATARRISELTSTAAFEAQARSVSALPSRTRGGRLDWLPVSNYPAGLRSMILALSPGEVTAPIQIQNGVALFQMRAVREVAVAPAPVTSIDYAAFYIPGGLDGTGQSAAANVRARVDTCDDLYGEARGLPEDRLLRTTAAPAEIDQDIQIELAKLDPGETSTVLTRNDGDTVVFLMLCARTSEATEEVDREAITTQLRTRRLNGFSEALIADMRASATILGN